VVTLLEGTLHAAFDNVFGLILTNDAVKGLKKFPERMDYLDCFEDEVLDTRQPITF